MRSLSLSSARRQLLRGVLLSAAALVLTTASAWAGAPAGPVLEIPDAAAKTEAEMKPYTDVIGGTLVKFDMLPIRGGKFTMGSPETEAEHKDDEGPQHEVTVEPFWMGKHEVTWDEYEVFMFALDIARRKVTGEEPTAMDKLADAVTRPTKPYTDMTFGMGHDWRE